MANNFSKEERVAFDKVLEDFDDLLVISRAADNLSLGSAQQSERQSDRLFGLLHETVVSG